MKKRYTFFPKNWLRAGMLTVFAASFSLNLQAQTVPVKQWDKTFGGPDGDQLHSLQQTSDGGYILGGSSQGQICSDKTQASKGSFDYWVIKLDAGGKKLWDKTFGGNDIDYLKSLQQTSDGGYILGGYSQSNISGDKSQAFQGANDYWVVKLDASGNKLWDKTFGGNGDDLLYSIKQTTDGGYILGGTSTSDISGDKSQTNHGFPGVSDFWVVKIDASGNKIWDKSFGGNDGDQLFSLQQTSDGGFILGGDSGSPISGDKSQASKGGYDYWVVKLDASGNKLWDKTFGGNNIDYLNSLQQTSDWGYILGGQSNSGISGDKSQASKGGYDYWVVKLDASGNKLWDKTFGGNDKDVLFSLQQTFDGGYILGGTSISDISGDKTQSSKGYEDYWIVKLDTSGNKLWDKTFGGNDRDELYSLQQTSDGGYILGGSSSFSGISGDKSQTWQGAQDYWVVKLGYSATDFEESSIYPNPSQGKFNLQVSGINAPGLKVTVSDLSGCEVLQRELQVTRQRISQELALPSVKGIYLLQLKAGKQTTTRKIVVE